MYTGYMTGMWGRLPFVCSPEKRRGTWMRSDRTWTCSGTNQLLPRTEGYGGYRLPALTLSDLEQKKEEEESSTEIFRRSIYTSRNTIMLETLFISLCMSETIKKYDEYGNDKSRFRCTCIHSLINALICRFARLFKLP